MSGGDVEIAGGGGLLLLYRAEKPKRNKFKHFVVKLAPGPGWKVASTGKRPTRAEFQQVLHAVTGLLIRADQLSGEDTATLDNVVLKGKG